MSLSQERQHQLEVASRFPLMTFQEFCATLDPHHLAMAQDLFSLYTMEVYQKRHAELKRLQEKPVKSDDEVCQDLQEAYAQLRASWRRIR